jgi:hypothetical protein
MVAGASDGASCGQISRSLRELPVKIHSPVQKGSDQVAGRDLVAQLLLLAQRFVGVRPPVRLGRCVGGGLGFG